MNRAETLALFAKGKDAWNCWAHDLARERDALRSCDATQPKNGELLAASRRPIRHNSAAEDWLKRATANFSNNYHRQSFKEADFSGCAFPGPAQFQGATFFGDALFTDAQFM